jgi:hypothetical protein
MTPTDEQIAQAIVTLLNAQAAGLLSRQAPVATIRLCHATAIQERRLAAAYDRAVIS